MSRYVSSKMISSATTNTNAGTEPNVSKENKETHDDTVNNSEYWPTINCTPSILEDPELFFSSEITDSSTIANASSFVSNDNRKHKPFDTRELLFDPFEEKDSIIIVNNNESDGNKEERQDDSAAEQAKNNNQGRESSSQGIEPPYKSSIFSETPEEKRKKEIKEKCIWFVAGKVIHSDDHERIQYYYQLGGLNTPDTTKPIGFIASLLFSLTEKVLSESTGTYQSLAQSIGLPFDWENVLYVMKSIEQTVQDEKNSQSERFLRMLEPKFFSKLSKLQTMAAIQEQLVPFRRQLQGIGRQQSSKKTKQKLKNDILAIMNCAGSGKGSCCEWQKALFRNGIYEISVSDIQKLFNDPKYRFSSAFILRRANSLFRAWFDATDPSKQFLELSCDRFIGRVTKSSHVGGKTKMTIRVFQLLLGQLLYIAGSSRPDKLLELIDLVKVVARALQSIQWHFVYIAGSSRPDKLYEPTDLKGVVATPRSYSLKTSIQRHGLASIRPFYPSAEDCVRLRRVINELQESTNMKLRFDWQDIFCVWKGC